MTPDQLQAWLQLGLGGLLLAALFAGFKRVWVWGYQLRAKELEAEFWRDLYLRQLTVNDKALSVAEKDA